MMEYSKDVQNSVLSFVLNSEKNVKSPEFVLLLADNNIDIDDVIVILQHIQNRIESYLIILD